MIRQAHERPEGMDEGSVVMAGLKADNILAAVEMVTGQAKGTARAVKLISDYDTQNVSIKVSRIILSYTEYVNRTVWSMDALPVKL